MATSEPRLRRVTTALILMSAVGRSQADDLCETLPPPPPPAAQATCNRAIVEYDMHPRATTLATAKDLTIFGYLGIFGVEGLRYEGLGAFPNVFVLNIKPDVLGSREGTKLLCQALQKVDKLGTLTSFERSAHVQLRMADPTDPMYPDQRALFEEIHAAEAWDRISRIPPPPTPVLVAVVDSGIHYSHPDLVDSMWHPGPSGPHGKSFLDPGKPDDTDDTYGHGTNVAGTLAATTNNGIGVASIAWPGHIQAVIARFSQGAEGCVDDMVSAIRYAAYDVGARIINLSAGTSENASQLLKQLQQISRDKPNTLIVAAVDNRALNLDDPRHPVDDFPTTFHLPNVISVQASGLSHDFHRSAYGSVSVHLAAPEDDVQTTGIKDNLYIGGTGTSVSAPQVSATAALISEFAPQWTYSQIKQYIIDAARDPTCTATHPRTPEDSTLCGRSQSNGELNVDAATGAPLKFTWPAPHSPWRVGSPHEVSWKILFATDQCREVQLLYTTTGGEPWTPVPNAAPVPISTPHEYITLPDSIPRGTVVRLAARCTDTARLERWSAPFVLE